MVRRLGSVGIAVVITFGLFWVMHYLAFLNAQFKETNIQSANIDFVRVKEDSSANRKERKLPDKVEQNKPPPTPKVNMSANRPDLGDTGGPVIGIPAADIAGGPALGAALSDMDAVPLVRIAPEYPRRAAQLGLKGWVLLEFTVTTLGTTEDIRVADSDPPRTFDRAAMRAVKKFKYRPKVVDGQPVVQHGVQIVISFDPTEQES
jgi:protein TonB